MAEDIRWQQRFSNYRKALELLEDFLEPPALNEREQLGLIKAFEYTYCPVFSSCAAGWSNGLRRKHHEHPSTAAGAVHLAVWFAGDGA